MLICSSNLCKTDSYTPKINLMHRLIYWSSLRDHKVKSLAVMIVIEITEP